MIALEGSAARIMSEYSLLARFQLCESTQNSEHTHLDPPAAGCSSCLGWLYACGAALD